jgi:hypothetical protein
LDRQLADEERTEELTEFLIGPIKTLGLKARVHGGLCSERAAMHRIRNQHTYAHRAAEFETVLECGAGTIHTGA